MSLFIDILILVILVALSALANASESALFSLGRYQSELLYEKGARGSKNLKKLLDDPHKLLITLLFFNTLIMIGASAFATTVFIRFFENNVVGITTGIMTFFILIFGEITPKSIALKYNKQLSLSVAGIIRFLQIIFYPFIAILDFILDIIHKLFRFKSSVSALSEEELKGLVAISEKEGSIKSSERRMIHSVFRFDDTTVADVMTPRTNIIFAQSQMTLQEIIQLSMESGHSRFPVYDTDKDNIVGIIHLKDILKYVQKGRLSHPVTKVMKKASIFPESKKLYSTLKIFQKGKGHMALVVDEYGGVVGLVTLEDILEEIVGEIVDESEKIKPKIVRLNKGTFRISGDADIKKVIKKLNLRIENEPDYDTFGGYLLAQLERIPHQGEEIKLKNISVTIEEVFKNRIKTVRVVKK